MTQMPADRRKQLLILPAMQKRIIRRAAVIPSIALLALGTAVAVHCMRVIGEAYEHGVDLPGMRFLLPAILAFVIAMAGLLLHQAVHFSNKIGGPAYRLILSMRQFRAGELPGKVKLRGGDYLTEVADELNDLLDWIRAQHGNPEPAPAPDVVDVETLPALHDEAEPSEPKLIPR
jgi:hypothetical protein